MHHKTELKDELQKLLQQTTKPEACKSNNHLVRLLRITEGFLHSVTLPRYVRVNCLKTTVDKVIKTLEQDGFTLVSQSELFEAYQLCKTDDQCTGTDKHKHFCMDADIPHLLVFCCCVALVKHKLTIASEVILQDKVCKGWCSQCLHNCLS